MAAELAVVAHVLHTHEALEADALELLADRDALGRLDVAEVRSIGARVQRR